MVEKIAKNKNDYYSLDKIYNTKIDNIPEMSDSFEKHYIKGRLEQKKD